MNKSLLVIVVKILDAKHYLSVFSISFLISVLGVAARILSSLISLTRCDTNWLCVGKKVRFGK